MLIKIAWRNIWRSRTRSLVVIGAIIIGVWAVLFLVGFSTGMVNSIIVSSIENELSHIQIHNPHFLKDKEAKYYLKDIDQLVATVEQNPAVVQAGTRTLISGMLISARGVDGVQIRGVDPKAEASLTQLDKKIVQLQDSISDKRQKSQYFTDKKQRLPSILVSKNMAERLKIKVRHKLRLRFRNIDGKDVEMGFKVVGIYQTGNGPLDKVTVFVEQKTLNANFFSDAVDPNNQAHEIAILVKDIDDVDTTRSLLNMQMPEQCLVDPTTLLADTVQQGDSMLIIPPKTISKKDSLLPHPFIAKAETFREISPSINLHESQMEVSTNIIIFIVMLALIFGIINTMLMAVLERLRELGMLMAVGMKRRQVFGMIVLETLYLGMIATPIGVFLGWITILYFGTFGVDLSSYSSGVQQFGMGEIIYPELEFNTYIQVAISVFFTAVLAALYPAYKAIRLRPVEAIRQL
ncbi:MAG: ABC transporter permease [Saprospiraceae bacterium]|nr:ABC transporter permease [Saprospiraceae bacterium]